MNRVSQALSAIVLAAGGVVLARALILSKPTPALVEAEVPVTYVDVVEARRQTHTVTIAAMGVVRAEREVILQPEVGGKVVEASTNLVPGGILAKDDVLLRIDPRDYSAAVAGVQAELAQARLQVREESSLGQVAAHEWQDRPDVLTEDTLSFALRQPHLEAATARVSSVKTRIEKAKRDLSRTALRAPFDAIVLDETVDVGQMVGPQTPIARLAGIERFWIQVSLPVDDLSQLIIPGVNTSEPTGSAAKITYATGEGVTATRDGVAVRLLANVEQRGRMAQLLVSVDDPLDRGKPIEQRQLPLLLDRYVQVVLSGRELTDVVLIPAQSVHAKDRVWVVDSSGRLRPRTIKIVRRESGIAIVGDGLTDGDQVVTTPLTIATDGMKVTISPLGPGSTREAAATKTNQEPSASPN